MGLGFLASFKDKIYALLRIVVGFLFTCHGLQKIFLLFGGPHEGTPAAIRWSAGLIELVGGVLILLGFMTGPAAFLCSGMMAVGYFMAHQPQGALPIVNGGELAAVYSFLFLYIAARGSGVWSVDAMRGSGGTS